MEIVGTTCAECLPPDTDTRYMELRPCFRHAPKADGSEDALASLMATELQFSGSSESSMETNRAYANFQKKLRKEKECGKKGCGETFLSKDERNAHMRERHHGYSP